MVDYYQVLGVPQSASQDDIKSRFKKLALQYHPDRNPGDHHAEERFKEINRAYQILSDPYKRHQHDVVLQYQYNPPQSRSQPRRSTYEPFYYPPHARRRRGPVGEYQTGWPYIRTQIIAFGFVLLIAALVMGVKYTYDQYRADKSARLAELRAIKFAEAQDLFDQGKYRDAMIIIMDMRAKNKVEPSIRKHREKFLGEILLIADDQLTQGNYEAALLNFKIVSDFQPIENPKVYQKMADCHSALGQYGDAVKDLDRILAGDKDNLMLNMQIGTIYMDILESPEQARPYFDRARKRVKQIFTQTYGRAAELVMDPKETPQIYFEVFHARAKVLTVLGDHKEAIKDCNWSVFLKPEHGESFFLRGQNYFEIGKNYKACKNWNEANRLGHEQAGEMLALNCE